ncbi:hypothetical protein IPM62_06090 [Candidatus Woesebacteria bacterium]|nr:MAG: hypothetical protein IPM62_06090 [Candidatus Woesebacteria bacterium]
MTKSIQGSITPAILVIATSFLVVMYGILFILTLQFDFSRRQTASESALNIAEAGVNYYRWHLAHDPDDLTDGTGQPGPYVHTYVDPQGDEIGKYSLEIESPDDGSSMVTIKATGWLNEYPHVTRTIEAQYGQPSFTQYSFSSNASTWYGTNITVNGRVHSNNGVRMDGTNTALVTSAKETYTCGSETGCNPSRTRPGVWGVGGDQGLWQFPAPAIDFDSISFNYSSMKDAANSDGLYLAPSGRQGYHLLFFSNGTVRVNTVTGTNYYNAYTPDDGCQRRYERITNESFKGTYSLGDTPIIFAEDHLWIEGVVRGRTTVVAAKFPIESNNMNIWIPNNITYNGYDGSNALGLIAQNDIYFTRNIPENFRVDAVLMAQTGKVIRHGYLSTCGNTTQAVKDSLTLNGSLISFEKSYWNFGTPPSSGFETREVNYDANLFYNPPPYFPSTGNFEFISWIEK